MFFCHGVVLLCPVIFLCLFLAFPLSSAPVYSEHPNSSETLFLYFCLDFRRLTVANVNNAVIGLRRLEKSGTLNSCQKPLASNSKLYLQI